jgi:hypothetical protein
MTLSKIGSALALFGANYIVYTLARFWRPTDWQTAQDARQRGTLGALMAWRLPVACLLPHTVIVCLLSGLGLTLLMPVADGLTLLVLLSMTLLSLLATIWSLLTLAVIALLCLIPPVRQAAVARMADILDQRRANGLDA